MKLPLKIIRKIQYDYSDSKYKEGSYAFASIDEETIETIIYSFLAWAEDNNFIDKNQLDISSFIEKK